MPFSLPSLDEFRDMIMAFGRALFPDLNFGSRRSYHGKMSTFIAAAGTQLHSHIATAQSDLHPLTAGPGKPIDDWCFATGVFRKPATPARKAKAGRIRGVGGAVVLAGSELTHPQTGLLFRIANAEDITMPGPLGQDSQFDADIAAVNTGSQTRLLAGETLEFVGGISGIEGQVVLQNPLDEDGFDAEAYGSQRQRFLRTFSEPRSGGTSSEFAGWAEESAAPIRKAYPYPKRNGLGSMDLVVFYAARGSARAVSAEDRQIVLEHVRTRAPFQVSGEGGALRVIETIPDEQDIEILLSVDDKNFRFDWTGSALVFDYEVPTRRLIFTAPLPLSLRAGHRLILVGTGIGSGEGEQDGRQYRVESIFDATSVILDKAPPVIPENNDIIYPGGPLVDPVREAILGHLNGEIVYAGRGRTPIPESKSSEAIAGGPSVIGLDELAAGVGASNPGLKYGSWQGGIVRTQLFKIATYKGGVGNAVILQPAADYEPADPVFPMNHQIHYVSPRAVIVRSA